MNFLDNVVIYASSDLERGPWSMHSAFASLFLRSEMKRNRMIDDIAHTLAQLLRHRVLASLIALIITISLI